MATFLEPSGLTKYLLFFFLTKPAVTLGDSLPPGHSEILVLQLMALPSHTGALSLPGEKPRDTRTRQKLQMPHAGQDTYHFW